jgi:hypothetical protein
MAVVVHPDINGVIGGKGQLAPFEFDQTAGQPVSVFQPDFPAERTRRLQNNPDANKAKHPTRKSAHETFLHNSATILSRYSHFFRLK